MKYSFKFSVNHSKLSFNCYCFQKIALYINLLIELQIKTPMKKILLALTLVLPIGMFSQNIEVTYKTNVVEINKSTNKVLRLKTIESNTLLATPTKSVYRSFNIDTIISLPEGGKHHQEKDTLPEILFKDLVNQWGYSKKFAPNPMIVKEEGYAVKWKITENYKTILGYKTQQATGSFRGRSYSVYFCPELPYRTGPFKFDGLPGLILEVVSDDAEVKIEALSIQFNSKEKVENPFEGKPTVSWAFYYITVTEFIDKFNRSMVNDEGESMGSISIKGIELTE
jgi:GLPGLI family protein